jgi:hypothetical protein
LSEQSRSDYATRGAVPSDIWTPGGSFRKTPATARERSPEEAAPCAPLGCLS